MIYLEFLPSTIVGFVACGLAGVFWYADPQSPTTRSLVLAFAAMGLAVGLSSPFTRHFADHDIPLWLRWQASAEWLTFVAFGEWMLRVARTAQPSARAMRRMTLLIRHTQAATVVYLVVSLINPGARLNVFFASLGAPESFMDPRFWWLATPVALGTVGFVVTAIMLSLEDLDPAERVRAVAVAIAIPFMALAMLMPVGPHALCMAIGIVIFMVGMVRYLVMQGERGQFMSRFLSPEVAKVVRTQGMEAALKPQTLELSVLCCDLRGFTAYAASHESAQVIELLREYYDAVGEAVAQYGGTVKDYAGDGILILVGAPLPEAGHARHALSLARQVLAQARGVAHRWSDAQGKLGAGVGVASGVVTVGIIGSDSRMEYTAVGSAVNLASRLCEEARDGEILVAARTAELTGPENLEDRGVIHLKGFAADTRHYALTG